MVKVREALPQQPDGSVDMNVWIAKHCPQLSDSDKQRLIAAEALARGSIKGTTPYQLSPYELSVTTANILVDIRPDVETLQAAFLIYPVLNGHLTIEHVEQVCSPSCAKLLKGVMHLEQTAGRSSPTAFTDSGNDNFRRMILAIFEDIRVVLIRLAMQVCQLRESHKLDKAVQHKMATDTRTLYGPMANRLGIGQLKWELEDFVFRILEPTAYKYIAHLLDERRLDREEFILQVKTSLEEALHKEGIDADVTGRAKHIYSIWRKMSRKGVEFSEIYDVRAVRIFVNEIKDCYAALGVVHGLWQHIPHEFDDYIATPKGNGYRSLHTAVIGPEGKVIEVQIRTHQMHQEAELGVAAHWMYKEGKKSEVRYQNKLASLRQILDWQDEISSQFNSQEELQSEVLDDKVYVFTPKGDVIDLPQGSTALDFAFHIHSDLGFRCRGAKVNGVMVALTDELHSGDQVDILAAKTGEPSRDWLNPHLGYLRSSRARAKVLAFFKRRDRVKIIKEARELLEKDVKRLRLSLDNLPDVAKKLHFKETDDLLVALGCGELRSAQVIAGLQGAEVPVVDSLLRKPLVSKRRESANSSGIMIEGVAGDLMCHYAKCCKPIPGETIVGYITMGRGVTIHRADCLHALAEENEDRLIKVQWGGRHKDVYPVDIIINAYDRQGLLSDITSILAHEKINVTAVSSNTNKENNVAFFKITLEISGMEMLEKVMSRIAHLPNVFEVIRDKSR